MPIRIQALSEPFCVRPDGAPDPAPFARSAAYDQLFDEMLRYTRGETAGRSFLISGNRGAGKTTMVTRCIENIQKEMRNSTKPLRPIYVRLNGPDLLRPRQTTDDTAVMLREVTIALYRALADEFSRAFHNWFTVPSKNERAMRKLFDGVELAGQLAVELDGWPDLSTLRQYWDRAGRLETGVLFPNAEGQRHNQGILELIALSSAGQAFQQVSGKMQDKRQAALSAEDSQTTGIDSALKLKDLIAPFIAIGSGAAAAIGAGVLNTGPVTALLSGCVVTLASAVTFRVSRSRTRGAKVTQEVTFLPDRDVASLGRILPLLVERIRAAGLAPIFVVDELDKVDRLFDRMRDLVKHLKQFVTEHSFFCFITERSYFEQLEGDFADGGYPEEYTYFTDRLFVCFTAQALHEHLQDLLVIEYPTADQLETLSIEKALLPFILLRRSRLHMFDLVRELDALFTGRTLTQPPGTLRTQVFRYQIAVQVAIELMLRRGPLATVLEQERDLRQIVYDALYYPARQWETGDAILDVSSKAFFEEMTRCVPAVETLPESQKRLLLESVQRLAQYLADLSTLHSEVKDLVDEKKWPEMQEAVVAAIPVGYRLLKPVAGSVEKFEWGYTIHGIPVQAADVALADNAKNDIGLIDKMGEFVAGWLSLSLEKLATEYHVLPTSPPWADVKEALKAVKLAQDTRAPYSLLESHTNILREYAGRLQTNAKALSMALSIVAKLARLSSLEEPEARVDAAFRALSAGLHLTGAPEETTLRRLARTATEAGIATHNPVDMAAGGRFRDWREAVAAPPLARATAEVTAETRAQVFSGWANRLKENLGRVHDFPVGWIDVLGPVLGLEAVALLKPDVRNTTLLAWSKLAVMALQGKPPEEAQYAPFAFAAAALASCGFVQAEVLQDLVTVPASQLELDCMSTLAPAIKALDLAKQKREAEILILSLREKSLAELWMPSTKYRAMLLPPVALEGLLTSPGYVVLRFKWLIAESDDLTKPVQPSNPELTPDKFPETTKLIKSFSREARGYMAARVPSTRLELDGRLLGACRSVDDAGDRMLTTSSPPTPS